MGKVKLFCDKSQLKSKILQIFYWEIIMYSRSIINACCSLLSHEWWILLIKFMVGPAIHVRRGSTHL